MNVSERLVIEIEVATRYRLRATQLNHVGRIRLLPGVVAYRAGEVFGELLPLVHQPVARTGMVRRILERLESVRRSEAHLVSDDCVASEDTAGERQRHDKPEDGRQPPTAPGRATQCYDAK